MLPTDDLTRAWYHLNDSGNAKRFKSRCGDRFLYVRGRGWHFFDGARWSNEGADARALLAARETASQIFAEAEAMFKAAGRDGEKATQLNKRAMAVKDWAERSGSINRLKGMLSIAAAESECDLDQFDRDPLALNVQNGTVRFYKDQTGLWQVRLDSHDARDRITRICAFAWKPDASRARWDAHLAKTMPDLWERKFLMRQLGYVASGLRHEQVFFIWQGRGGDGKSVTSGVIRRVLGSYAASADVKTFLEDKTGRSAAAASPDLARLSGATRFVSCSEPPRGARLNEGLIKQFTGGAPLAARHLNKDLFEFIPAFALVLECNARPAIGGGDDGIWRRVIIIPWRVQLKRDEMDPETEAKIVTEGEGVLASIVEGVIRYLERGLSPPTTIEAAHTDYKLGSNPFRDWMENCTAADPNAVVLIQTLYESYNEMMETQGLEPMHKRSFGLALSDCQVMRTTGQPGTNRARRKGLRLLTAEEIAERNAVDAAADALPHSTLTEAAFTSQCDDEIAPGAQTVDPSDADAFRYEGD